MKTYFYPQPSEWPDLLRRPTRSFDDLIETVMPVMQHVRARGDAALRDFSLKFDRFCPEVFALSKEEIETAGNALSEELKYAIRLAYENVRAFHAAQETSPLWMETMPGVSCGRRNVAIEKVGLYIPGGSAPLFSTVLMLGVPAKLAGCRQIVLCSPPNEKGALHPAILFAAHLIGIEQVYRVGGAQAIAALTFGTESVPKVDKIFGPGNQYVTMAKQLATRFGVAIDMPAGPSEVLVIADDSVQPDFVAADLLAQAEHGADSQVVLVTTNENVPAAVQASIDKFLSDLPRRDVAAKALENSLAVVVKTDEDAMALSNAYAPEHLILATVNADELAEQVVNAGSVFIGAFTPESLGDYASGTNHTLPTDGWARSFSGVSLDSFYKKITFQKVTSEGLKVLGPAVECMAEAEELAAHKLAVTVRLQALKEK